MTTVYSERKGANAELLVQQWHEAFQNFELWVIDAAWKRCRSEEKFFPSIATFLGYVRAERPPVPPQRSSLAEIEEAEQPFCRDGRDRTAEIAHRAAQCLRWRQQYAKLFKPDPRPELEPKPAAQGGATAALREIAQRAGYWHGDDEETEAA